MSQKNTLDKKFAEKFMDDSSSVNLSIYTEITVEAAQVLAGYGKREGDRPDGQLDLSGLTEISEECAGALEKHAGEINLYGLNEISPKVANKLGKKSGTLLLNGLNTISLEVAKELANHSDGYLSLDGLESIDEDIAEAMAKHTGGWLSLDGLSEVSEVVAEKLITSSDELRLGLTKISDSVARVLASFSGNLIMEKLSIEEISNLAAYLLSQAGFDDGWDTSKLCLKSTVLTKEIAHEMVQNGFPREDIMEKFTSLEECAAEEFGKIKDQACELKLIGLKKLSEKSAEALSRFQGNYLSINPEEISDQAIETLLQGLKCEFCLGNEKITDSVANILKTFKGPVLYLGITEISASCAKALADFRGSLHLNHLKNIPSEALEEFANYSGPELLLNGFEEKIPKCR